MQRGLKSDISTSVSPNSGPMSVLFICLLILDVENEVNYSNNRVDTAGSIIILNPRVEILLEFTGNGEFRRLCVAN